jgi:hypothetical protein
MNSKRVRRMGHVGWRGEVRMLGRRTCLEEDLQDLIHMGERKRAIK